jgi:hypothetical protein
VGGQGWTAAPEPDLLGVVQVDTFVVALIMIAAALVVLIVWVLRQ